MTTTTDPTGPLGVLREMAEEAVRKQADADRALAGRDAMALALYDRGAGTYNELAEALKISRARVSQVLQEQRAKARALTST